MDAAHLLHQPGSGPSWRNLTLFLITICIVILCLLMLRPFLPALTGAIVLAIVTRRPHKWIAARVKNASLAATISLILIILSFIGPAIFIGERIGRQILSVVKQLQSGSMEQRLHDIFNQFPRISAALNYARGNIDLTPAVEKTSAFVASQLGAILGGSFTLLVQVGILLFLLFFLYRDSERGVAFLRSIIPLRSKETDYLLENIDNSVQATFLGRFFVAGLQGLVAGITFAGLGMSAAALLGIATAFFAIIPSFGAFVIWLPIAIYFAATQQWTQALILVGIGSLIISTLDNFIYPILVGQRIPLHTTAIFLSVLGGILIFGVSGLILGPIVFTVAESLLVIWRRRINSGPLEESLLVS